MKLFEFEAKETLRQYGIVTPRGDIVNQPAEAKALAQEIGKPVVLKSQILVSGRGKAGGIVFASDADEAGNAAAKLLGSAIKGCRVECLLVEERLDIAAQFYASLTIDRQARTYVVLASISGGVDIEEIARTQPEKIVRLWIDITAGFTVMDAIEMLGAFHLDEGDADAFAAVLTTLYQVAMDNDAELVEINPLVRTTSGKFVTADARIIVDDNAVFRHPKLAARGLLRAGDTPTEAEARKQNLAYVDLDGNIGIIGNGAGLVMATMDVVQLFGGRPGNFLDLGGGGQVEKIKQGIMLVMAKPEITAVLVNILGGITRCDLVAEAVIGALKESRIKKPLVIRLSGTNEEEAVQILRQSEINSYHSMDRAARQVVKLAG